MKQNIKVFVILLMFTFCKGNKEEFNEYTEAVNKFDSVLVNHFPSSALDRTNDLIIKDIYHYHNTLSLILMRNSNNNELNLIENKYINYKLNQKDSCLIVVNDFLTKENMGDPFNGQKSTFNDKCNNYTAIPNFFELEFTDKKNTPSKLPQDFTIFLIESKNGLFSKEIDENKSSMPNSIYHGYSKGVAISKVRNKIVYWVITW